MKVATIALSAIAFLESVTVVHAASPASAAAAAAAAADDVKSSLRNRNLPNNGEGERILKEVRVLSTTKGGGGSIFLSEKWDGADGSELNPIQIVGGEVVDPPRKYKYFVMLNGCAGSLITPNLVLTAAHCFNAVGSTVVLGTHKRIIIDADEEENREIIPVHSKHPHPDYNSQTMENDLMIVKLMSASQKYGEHVVALDEPGSVDGLDLGDSAPHDLVVMGFGTLSSGGSASDEMMEVVVDYIENESCGNYPIGQITDDMLCAAREGKDACQGDSGGPIVDVQTGLQVGVVSWGYGCAQAAYPGIYSRVSEGYGWISGKIAELSGPVPPPPPPCPDNVSEWDGIVVNVNIVTDNYPTETSWSIIPSCPSAYGAATSPTYSTPNTNHPGDNICLPHGIYDFIIADTYGDGICCDWGQGSYEVLVDGTVVHEGGEFTDTESMIIGDACAPTTPPTTPPPTSNTPPTTPPPTSNTSPTTPPPTPTCVDLIVEIQMDSNPGQITWTLANACTGETVINGPKIMSPNTLSFANFCIPPTNYRFTIMDSIGGGLAESGYYLVTSDGEQVASGNQFDISESTFFGNVSCGNNQNQN